MKLRISVDPELCFGAASCVTVSPDHFRLNDQNKAEVMEPGSDIVAGNPIYERIIEADEAKKDELILSAQSCPVSAISIWNMDTGEKLYPKE
jgi:ferredoxin